MHPSGRRALPIVGVMGSGTDPHESLSVPLGRALATLPVHLLTGGGAGVMEAVSRGFCSRPERAGLCIGVLRGHGDGVESLPPAGYPNAWVEVSIRTHLPLSGWDGLHAGSRNHINVLTSDLVVALPGGAGTASEIELARRYGTPVILHGREPEHATGSRTGAVVDEMGSTAQVESATTLDDVLEGVRRILGLGS